MSDCQYCMNWVYNMTWVSLIEKKIQLHVCSTINHMCGCVMCIVLGFGCAGWCGNIDIALNIPWVFISCNMLLDLGTGEDVATWVCKPCTGLWLAIQKGQMWQRCYTCSIYCTVLFCRGVETKFARKSFCIFAKIACENLHQLLKFPQN